MSVWDRLQENAGDRLRIVIPEWGDDEPFVAYATQATVADEAQVRKWVKDPSSPETWARLVHQKLCNEDGTRVFAGKGFAEFQRLCPGALSQRIGQEIYLGRAVTEAEAAGN